MVGFEVKPKMENFIHDLNSGFRVIQALLENLTLKNLRTAFYLVTPNETTFSKIEDVPQFTDQVGSYSSEQKTHQTLYTLGSFFASTKSFRQFHGFYC